MSGKCYKLTNARSIPIARGVTNQKKHLPHSPMHQHVSMHRMAYRTQTPPRVDDKTKSLSRSNNNIISSLNEQKYKLPRG